jgi:nucleotide-binding universal stress UspA family protein
MPVPGGGVGPVSIQGEHAMMKVLIPVDGSENALQAVRHVVNRFFADSRQEVHLLHVCPPFSRHVSQFSSRKNRESYHREMADRALKPAQELLNKHSIPHAAHVELGDRAETIDRVAQRLRVDKIVIGTARKNSLTRLLQDSVTSRVLEIARVPVEVIVGSEVSKFERYGLPAGIGAAVVALMITAN